ncbi:MAG: trypsin-like serine protease, partial [Sphingobacteriales bacterium]
PEQRASGSGVIYTGDGYIITNNHVVAGADEINVTLKNRKTYKATVVGTDPSSDLAVIKIEADNLPYIVWGNSDEVKLGQWVLAIGYPLNLDVTVTAGIVSAKARAIGINDRQSQSPIESFIQTDAAVNQGNSGGALINTDGQLIGINSAIASPTGTYAGYSYAIPVNIVKKVVGDIVKYGTVQRAFIGISYPKDGLSDEQKKVEARKMEVYAAMIENLDYNVGRIIATLKKNGQYDNTLIFFVSDNGAEGFPRNANGFDNSLNNIGKPTSYVSIGPRWAEVSSTPFHLWKLTAGEGAVLSPAIIKLPSQNKAQSINTSFTSVKDISPTILEIAQISNPGSQYNGKTVHPITGKSWLSLLQNKTSTVYGDNFVFGDELHGNQYVRTANWKLELQAPYQGKNILG